ncbi:fimbria/pilus periplasmic chaperone [Pantoea sp. AMG 501]|uniref:fimbria/pilus periplasmic chaperone n=1 Tax=Pantoea sp. AMG 501 TaxID=2008894 RepID=UPI001482518F|nr:fimbria/pilus periplasmic chaperone [Pantoea sp. AMG 501]
MNLPAFANGITLSGSRIIYPADASQATISLKNDSETSTYLIQSWIATPDGNKVKDLIVTPPLYTSAPGNENHLRIMAAGIRPATEKETLYYFHTKAIPSVVKPGQEENSRGVFIATAAKIKLFVRPAGLKPARSEAEKMLEFSRQGAQLRIHNPSPYYLTLTRIKVGSHQVDDAMVPPGQSILTALPSGSGSTVTWGSVNDYGGIDNGTATLR